MLHKEDIIKTIKAMNLPSNKYWITSGAALVIHDVKADTGDIDLGCTTELFDELLKKGYKYKIADDNTRIMAISESVEILENWFVDEIEIIEDLPIGSLESIKKQKAELGREKDFRDIKLIDEYLKLMAKENIFKQLPELETERLILRKINMNDENFFI